MKKTNSRADRRTFARIFKSQRVMPVAVAVAFAASYALYLFATQFGAAFGWTRLSEYEVGRVAEQDLIVDRDIIYVDSEATRLKQEAQAALVPPVFETNDQITARVRDRLRQFVVIFRKMTIDGTSVDTAFLEIQSALPGLFTREDIADFKEYDGMLDLLPLAQESLDEVQSRGVISVPSDLSDSLPSIVTVGSWIEGKREFHDLSSDQIPTSDTAEQFIFERTLSAGVSEADAGIIARMTAVFVEENAFFDRIQTEARRERARQEVQPVVRKLVKGERIVRKGFILNEADMAKIQALGTYATTVNVNSMIGAALFLITLYAAGFIMFMPSISRETIERRYHFLLLGTAVVVHLIVTIVLRISAFEEGYPYTLFIPVALASMLVTTLLSHRSAIVMSVLLSLSFFAFSRSPYPILFAMMSGIAGTFSVKGAKKRIDLVRASLIMSVTNIGIVVILGFFANFTLSDFASAAGWAVVNGFMCGILNLGLLPFFEHLLNAATPFRLMELSDLNSPILKRMLTLAPGTYTHSVNVANLAESACREIGADPLLARVGAYYHDIGKIDQAEYFIENQTEGNKHDVLKPSLSVAVIKSHVKIGVERAKELGLPQVIIDIVAQHHGSGLISYFYTRAIKTDGEGRVSREDYSYSGTPPTTKEAAVVMLADSVEAVSRTLKKPTVAKLERFVWKTIIDKVTSQQMSNCELTFVDLESIKETFVHILASQFHSRIEYPDVKEAESVSR